MEKRGVKYYALEAIMMVKEDGKEAPRKIRTVIIEDKKQNKIFYSVMDKKVKIRQSRK